jgi:hypothetical protein
MKPELSPKRHTRLVLRNIATRWVIWIPDLELKRSTYIELNVFTSVMRIDASKVELQLHPIPK